MKALSVRPEGAFEILTGMKTIECRTWKTDYRGPLLICSSAKRNTGSISGYALCVVDLVDIVPFERKHSRAARMFNFEVPQDDAYAWIITNVRYIEPFPVQGQFNIFTVDSGLVHEVSGDRGAILKEYYYPLVYFGKSDAPDILLDARKEWEELIAGKNNRQIFGRTPRNPELIRLQKHGKLRTAVKDVAASDAAQAASRAARAAAEAAHAAKTAAPAEDVKPLTDEEMQQLVNEVRKLSPRRQKKVLDLVRRLAEKE